MTSENNSMREQQDPPKERHQEQHRPVNDGQGRIRFGNYDLVRRIDVGGMGEVYLARQRTAFDREVAIKIIRSDLVHDTTARKRFLREAEVNAHIKHEHILPLFEFGEEQGRLFLVSPYIAGGTLLRRLQTGPLSLAEVYQLFTALVEAVVYIHRRGVIHRDLKPSNILLDQEGKNGQIYVRLIDFGIATIQGMSASPPLTTAGTEVGTVAYMAPERLSGIAAPSNDIFSLGIILYQMLTGQLPAAEHHVTLPQPLEYVVNHCIAELPAERFTTAADLLKAFENAYQYLTTSNSTANQKPLAPVAVPAQVYMSRPSVKPRPPVHVSQENVIIPTRASTPRPAVSFKQEIKTLHSVDSTDVFDDITPPGPAQPKRFVRADYESPTVNIDRSKTQQGATPAPIPAVKAPRTPKRHRNPLFLVITLLIIFILLISAGLFFYEVEPALMPVVTSNINVGPQVQPIKQIFHIKGSVSQTNIDVNTATIPVKSLTASRNGSRTGSTSQQCILGFLDCHYVVQQQDVDALSAQLRPSLDKQIRQDLQQQIQSLGGAGVGDVQFTDAPAISKPTVGTESNTVTVTITGQQGQLAYISNSDAQQLARQLLNRQAQQLGPNYMLISSTIQIGHAVIQGVNPAVNEVLIDIAAVGDAQYHFPTSQLHSMQNALKGMKLKDAISFLQRQQGVDASSVSIHLSAGDTLPGDIQQIKIFTINPPNIPPVFLPQVTPVSTTTPNG